MAIFGLCHYSIPCAKCPFPAKELRKATSIFVITARRYGHTDTPRRDLCQISGRRCYSSCHMHYRQKMLQQVPHSLQTEDATAGATRTTDRRCYSRWHTHYRQKMLQQVPHALTTLHKTRRKKAESSAKPVGVRMTSHEPTGQYSL